MHTNRQRHRFVALLLGVASLLLAGWASADPPARVMRLGYTDGPVSFSPAGEDDWVQATVNRPLISGDRLWADAGARAELQVGPVMMRVGSGTSVTLLNLDDRVVQLQLAQGTLNVRVRLVDADQVLEIDTPNLAFMIRSAGDYRIDVDPAGNATTVLTRAGQAEVYGESAAYAVDAGRGYRFFGTGLVDYDYLDLPPPDELDLWAYDRDRRWDASVSARYVSPDVIGYQDLDGYGRWRVEPDYGNVWVPNRVGIGWAPYRDGHWAWIEPWGWTWVDDAPWGFAVSHYGRWASVRGTWCWVPGPVRARAVYAPALVAFVGGSNFQLSISTGGVGAVGWFPLGPRDVYRPAYPVSRNYFTNVNRSNTVINVTNITNVYNNRNVTNITYANQRVPGAVVAVPTTTFAQAQPVSRAALRVGRDTLATAQVTPVAAVAPMPVSVRGGATPAQRPPAQVLDRQTIAKTAPAPASVPFAARERLLAENPGQPLDRSAVGAMRSVTPAPTPNVQVVAPSRAASPVVAPPTARGSSETRGRAAPATAGTAPQAVPPAQQAVPAPLQRGGQTPMSSGQAPASPATQVPVPSDRQGRPEQRAAPAVVAPVPAAPQPRAMPESRATPESRARPGATVQVPAAAVPPAPAVVAPAPVPAAPEQRGRSEFRGQPPAVAAPPQAVAPMPMPAPAAPVQRAQPEQRGRQAPAQMPAPVARPAVPPAPPVTTAPAAPPQAARPPAPASAPMTRGPAPAPKAAPPAAPAAGAAPPPAPARQDRRTDEQKKADEQEMKRR